MIIPPWVLLSHLLRRSRSCSALQRGYRLYTACQQSGSARRASVVGGVAFNVLLSPLLRRSRSCSALQRGYRLYTACQQSGSARRASVVGGVAFNVLI